jgi:hypothetical protein
MLNTQSPLVDVSESTTISTVIQLDGQMLLSVTFPGTITSTTFTVYLSPDGVTYSIFYKDGADKSYTCAASKCVDVSADRIIGNYAKIVMGSAEGADRQLYAVSIPVSV